MADAIHLALQREGGQRIHGQRQHQLDAPLQRDGNGHEGHRLVFVAALMGCRVGRAPMRGHRLPRPHRADLTCRVVADRDDEVQRGRLGLDELVPIRAAKAIARDVPGLQGLPGERVDRAHGLAACGPGTEPTAPQVVHQGFGHDRSGGVAGANEENVVDLVAHVGPQ